jgi:hypothetical protein
LSDHQPDGTTDLDSNPATAAGVPHREASQGAAIDLPEPDFSRLRMARASLDAAFPQD